MRRYARLDGREVRWLPGEHWSVGLGHDVAELVDHFDDALIAVSPKGEIIFWSGGAERVFGYAKAEAIGRRLVELIVPAELRDEESQRIRTALEQGSATFEAVRRRKDGAPVHVDVTMKAVANGEGRVTHVAISKKDVSLLKYVREAELVSARFGGLLDAAPDAILLINQNGRIVLLNREAERLLGYGQTELHGQAVEVLVRTWTDELGLMPRRW